MIKSVQKNANVEQLGLPDLQTAGRNAVGKTGKQGVSGAFLEPKAPSSARAPATARPKQVAQKVPPLIALNSFIKLQPGSSSIRWAGEGTLLIARNKDSGETVSYNAKLINLDAIKEFKRGADWDWASPNVEVTVISHAENEEQHNNRVDFVKRQLPGRVIADNWDVPPQLAENQYRVNNERTIEVTNTGDVKIHYSATQFGAIAQK
jgi:hypothetical protein